jgi:hypothetical protein
MSTSDSKEQKAEDPTLSVLEEDDEFEEFAVAGKKTTTTRVSIKYKLTPFFFVLSLSISRTLQTGTIRKPTWHISEAAHRELRNRAEINYGKTIGTMMMLKKLSVYNFGMCSCLFIRFVLLTNFYFIFFGRSELEKTKKAKEASGEEMQT